MTLNLSRSEGSLTLAVETSPSALSASPSAASLTQRSRAPDTLTLPGATSSVFSETARTTDGFHGKRRHGLKKDEANCFRRNLVPSPTYEAKAAAYWHHIGPQRTKLTQTGANSMPNGKGVFWNGPEFRSTILTTEDEFNATQSSASGPDTPASSFTPAGSKMRRGGVNRAQKAVAAPHPLDKEEEHLTQILKHLFPCTRAEMARVGSSFGRRRGQTPKSRESTITFGPMPVGRGEPQVDVQPKHWGTSSSSALGDVLRASDTRAQPSIAAASSSQRMSGIFSGSMRSVGSEFQQQDKSPSKGKGRAETMQSQSYDPTSADHRHAPTKHEKEFTSASAGEKRQQGRGSVFMVKQEMAHAALIENQLGSNAIKLAAGASQNGAVHRDLGGGAISFVHPDHAASHKVYRAANHSASSVGHLVKAMQDPSAPTEKAMLNPFPAEDRKTRSNTEVSKASSKSSNAMTLEEKRDHERKVRERAAGKARDEKQFEESSFSLREFRKRLLDRYANVMEAFNSIDVDCNKIISAKEWNLILFQAGLANYRESRLLFDVMDANKDGTLTMQEFQVGLETIAPVISLEALRKRLLCVGFSSMYQALLVMDGGGEDTSSRPLSFVEFGEALRHVYISEPLEHRAIFEAVRSDPGPRTTDTRISISDLACALSAVSPCLLLEDLRFRLIRRYDSIGSAWQRICGCDHVESVARIFTKQEFINQATERSVLTRAEASKFFRLVDIDGSGEISRMDFVGALLVSMPSIMFEDSRHKVRQRYLSIDVAFRDACETIEGETVHGALLGDQAPQSAEADKAVPANAQLGEKEKSGDVQAALEEEEEKSEEEEIASLGLDDEVGLDMEEFADILEKLYVGRKDTKRLFSLIDGNERGKLTLFEFFKGIRLFAPSVMLEGVRLQLLHNGCSLADTLCSVVHDRFAPLDRRDLLVALQKLQVQCDESHLDLIFDFLDVRDAGFITMSEMIAVLQNIQPGGRRQVEASVLEERAEHCIKSEMAPFHKSVTDLKRRVKQGLRDVEDLKPHRKADDEQHGHLPRIGKVKPAALAALQQEGKVRQAAAMTKEAQRLRDKEGHHPGGGDKLPEPGARLNSAGGPPRCATAQGPQSTYFKLRSRLGHLGRTEAAQHHFDCTISNLKGYFNSADSTLQDQRPVLAQSYSWIDLHRSTESLNRALNPLLAEFRKASDAARL